MIKKLLLILYYRIKFYYKFKSFKPVKVTNENEILVCSSKGIFLLNRRCPHQGAYLEKAFKKDNILICHWHGCKVFSDLKGKKI